MASENKEAFLKNQKILKHYKKKVLKEIVFFFLVRPVEPDYKGQFHQWYSFVLDIVDTKLFKSTNVISVMKKIPTNVCSFKFVNKGVEYINVSKVFQMKNLPNSLSFNLQERENICVTTYKLNATISNKVVKYK